MTSFCIYPLFFIINAVFLYENLCLVKNTTSEWVEMANVNFSVQRFTATTKGQMTQSGFSFFWRNNFRLDGDITSKLPFAIDCFEKLES